jgi:transposase
MSELFKDVFSMPLSEGSIANMIETVHQKSLPVYEQIKQQVCAAKVVGSDKTGMEAVGKKWWAWAGGVPRWKIMQYTYISASDSRGKQVIQKHFPEGFSDATLTSDRWAAQLQTVTKSPQLCLAHLLRDCNYIYIQEQEKSSWIVSLKKLFQKAIKLKQEQICYHREDKKAKALEEKMNILLSQAFCKEKHANPGRRATGTFPKSMSRLRDSLLVFPYNKEVPPDNNTSEQAIRTFKVKKIRTV